jgi:hypothetical protein
MLDIQRIAATEPWSLLSLNVLPFMSKLCCNLLGSSTHEGFISVVEQSLQLNRVGVW